MRKIADITAHVKANSPIQVEIGGYAEARGTNQHNQGLSDRRVDLGFSRGTKGRVDRGHPEMAEEILPRIMSVLNDGDEN
jgi:hypothetical protein